MQTGCTCCVQLSLLELGLIYDQGGVAGQLQQPTDQAVGRVVLVGDEARLVHALDAHPQVVGLQGEKTISTHPVLQLPQGMLLPAATAGLGTCTAKQNLSLQHFNNPKYPNAVYFKISQRKVLLLGIPITCSAHDLLQQYC